MQVAGDVPEAVAATCVQLVRRYALCKVGMNGSNATDRTSAVGAGWHATRIRRPECGGSHGTALETSFFRVPSPKPRWLYTTHLEGNAQADTRNHGRPSQVVLLYAAVHYPIWQAELGRPDIGPGAFGEELHKSGLSEETVCVGDIYHVGAARIQVIGPRYPCWKISVPLGQRGADGTCGRDRTYRLVLQRASGRFD